MRTSKCRSCKARIIWTRNRATWSRMPLDAEPVPVGTRQSWVIDGRDGNHVPLCAPPGLFDSESLRYLSHFVTCPQADDWRTRSVP